MLTCGRTLLYKSKMQNLHLYIFLHIVKGKSKLFLCYVFDRTFLVFCNIYKWDVKNFFKIPYLIAYINKKAWILNHEPET